MRLAYNFFRAYPKKVKRKLKARLGEAKRKGAPAPILAPIREIKPVSWLQNLKNFISKSISMRRHIR